MLSRVSHRGPDGSGITVLGSCTLGHARLAVIDLEGGKQPLCNEDATVWITLNGEIYNHAQLRRELIAHGHRFATRSDTEVIVHAYEQWGQDCLLRLRGMFAFVIRDVARGVTFVARDPLGIKPLCYVLESGRFAVASEVRALRGIPEFRSEADPAALGMFLELGFIPAPYSAYRSIRKLPPGHWMEVDDLGSSTRPVPYWNWRFEKSTGESEVWLAEAERSLEESVLAHLVSDVPVGVFLSGGIDSSLIASMLPRGPSAVSMAFTSAPSGELDGEWQTAAATAKQLGLEFHVAPASPPEEAALGQIVTSHGEPFGDPSAILAMQLSASAARRVKVVLTGDGGDEMFCGYRSHRLAYRREEAGLPGGSLVDRVRNGLASLAGRGISPAWWRESKAKIAPSLAGTLLGRSASVIQEIEGFYESLGTSAKADGVRLAQWLDARVYMAEGVLRKVDIATMQHGLEARTPFIDIEVARLCGRVPTQHHFGGEPKVGKRILREILRRRGFEALSALPKRGFAAPLAAWLTPENPLVAQLRAEASGGEGSLAPHCHAPTLRALLDSGRSEVSWLLLVLREWYRQQEEPLAPPPPDFSPPVEIVPAPRAAGLGS